MKISKIFTPFIFVIILTGSSFNCWAESSSTTPPNLALKYAPTALPSSTPSALPSINPSTGSSSTVNFGLAALPQPPLTVPQTLRDAYLSSVHRSETLGVQQEMLVQSHEQQSQGYAALFPTVNGTGTFLRQQSPTSATGSAIYPATQNTVKFTADQPLFRGFRDFALLRQRRSLVDAQFYALINAARQLFYSVATAYYNVLMYQSDEKNYQIEIEVNRKRLDELHRFYSIGRSQLTDVLTFEANIASLEAQLEATRGQLENAKDVLAYLTGWNRNTPLKDKESTDSLSENIDTYLSRMDERADVQAALENVKANDEGIPIAWGSHLPSLDLIGDYYAMRPGALSNVYWDAELAITIPIFQGGTVQSQVRQAESVARQYSLSLSQTRRSAEEEIRLYYDAMVADRKQKTKLNQLVTVSKKNSETEIQYYRNGLVTNLDVLTAITTYQDAQRQLNHNEYQVQLDGVNLEAATGQRPEIYVPSKK